MSCNRDCQQGRKCDCTSKYDKQLDIATLKLLIIIVLVLYSIILIVN